MKINLIPKTYGRTKGKIKKSSLLNYYKNINKYLIDSFPRYKKKLILEIGSGNGENIIKLSNLFQDKLLIACEVYIDGNSSLVNKLESNKIKNIKIFDKSCFYLFNKIKKFSIDQIWILFPDPWPKKKHNKRRLITEYFINEIYSLLAKNGKVYIATDDKNYFLNILINFQKNNLFYWHNDNPNSWNTKFQEMAETSYYLKAMKISQKPKFMIFKKKICLK
tara:strand:- start:977 stop:1639 length:663 start_codon:yes stop_codon:yes gene_type:complete